LVRLAYRAHVMVPFAELEGGWNIKTSSSLSVPEMASWVKGVRILADQVGRAEAPEFVYLQSTMRFPHDDNARHPEFGSRVRDPISAKCPRSAQPYLRENSGYESDAVRASKEKLGTSDDRWKSE